MTHKNTHTRTNSIRLLWERDRPDAETSTWQRTHLQKTSTPPAGFELAIPGSERWQTHTLDYAANGIGRFEPLCRGNLSEKYKHIWTLL